MKNTTICLVDDHKIVRQGLKELLEKIGDYNIAYEFDNGELLLNALPLKDTPTLFILDYSMPGINGIETLEKLLKENDEFKVLLLTQHSKEEIINEAYYYGARGVLHKNCTAQELKTTIENIIQIGYKNVTEIISRVKAHTASKNKQNRKINLTDREVEFLKLVCNEKEYTYEQMADIMGLSIKSIEAYRAALFERFNIKSKVGLVLFSHKYQLTEPFL
ncbi:DNA-binding response regulator [Flavobacterium suaedae]|uniref:DNA-binding response regulator n=1 Tax=Flavobacterium suaedae TaxID=1767027 RepID=A0ABQ1JYR7_9FLAO|nr:response regulator transcription factor [Flavobacterium suaedae]GGB81548.1 DNA-binding response regulator [Flavobacterium suaedae]